MWALELRETGDFLGLTGFAEPEGWPGFELAWTLARRWWGHGYATKGARAALAHAFEVLGKERVISLIDPRNQRSIRVAQRIGQRLQGRIDHFGREMLCYGIDRCGHPLPLRTTLTASVPPDARSACRAPATA
jgi:RimJ/RimL family protein N-acetyltransferase